VAVIIREAATDADYAAFGALIREYVGWCRERYRDDPWLIEAAFSYQSLDDELGRLRTSYGPPKGRTLLADVGGEVGGAVAYRDLGREGDQRICEMKRLYVPAGFHGRGLGKALCQSLIAQAAADGFSLMRLDTGKAFTEAIRLYESVGFSRCAPYIDYPEGMTPLMVFMDIKLAAP
jgi:ribosomal protein S18 acetylase RimI-like enzyme